MAANRKFGPAFRIKKRREFLDIQENARKLRSRNLLLAIRPRVVQEQENSENQRVSRIGITVTKRVDKRAAARNRLKRRIREIFRVQRSYLKDAFDLVVIARDGACELSFRELETQLLELFQRARIMKTRGNRPFEQRAKGAGGLREEEKG